MKDHVLNKKVLLVAGCISVSACLQVFPDYFIYWRENLLGEFWRLWTAHWVHVGWIHFLLNIMAFACLPFIFPHTKVWHILSLLFLLPPFISLVFYFYLPNIDAYAGLSGVLHGLYTAVALVYLQYRKERNFAFLVLGLIVAKLIWENTFGQTGTAQLIGSPVLTEAHLYGAIGGAIFGGCYWLIQRFK
ncbi:rhombosortase [Acinetobacter baumannii]|uniref:rhombosortase n=1 Tax=Acinetobacter baumannii TaxID=470 RepID=UPI002148D58E|nr:rhombosortase [Acinetobacter baumannii]MCR0007414.1 rhombosortase [Acinetobacter baumannii]MDC4806592.1 rhombosortase [Acinetobacter baumannii]MDC5140289.1 rhombosortase [Acinetobacter baumannii]HAV3581091.1 rhombosortase [Acinetobacter baumannii]HAV4461185.1 rhombosortase [Acinetobacter baumannii]